ncbi:hypothetical protein BD779DRAFT_201319 [Infundibulicybe gibba]|nr:hypothetical protein BD779DRAFT_201319 [Infundibulicybe gibba]
MPGYKSQAYLLQSKTSPRMTPQESAAELTLERYFLASDFVSGVGYGIQAVLYATCAVYLWRQRKARGIYAFTLVYMTLLFTLSSVMQITQAHRVELTFVDNKNTFGGPWAYEEWSAGGLLNILSQAAQQGLLFSSELFMVWRCWVVWCSVGRRTAYLVITFPLLMLLAALATGAVFLTSLAHPTSRFELLGGTYTVAWDLAYYTLIIGTNVVLTVLILIRLTAHKRLMPTSLARTQGAYTSLITMMIESSAAYSIIGAACLITSGMNSPAYLPFVSATVSAQQISGYLIIARLAHGQAWQTDTATRGGAQEKPA